MGAPFDLPEAAEAHAIHMRRQLERAVHHGTALMAALGLPQIDALDAAIATLDALDGPGEDMEDDEREDVGDAEPSLGAPENHPARFHIDMDCRCHAGRRNHLLGDQTTWAAGGLNDLEDAFADLEAEPGYDLPEGDDERCASEHDGCEPVDCGEPYLSVVEWDGAGDNWGRSGHGTSGWGTDVEDVEHGAMPHRPRPPAVYRSTVEELRQRARALKRQTIGPSREGLTFVANHSNIKIVALWGGLVR